MRGGGNRGSQICECPLCHERFSGVQTFELHRQPGKHPNPGAWLGECRDPASKGMTKNPRGVWSRPAESGRFPVHRIDTRNAERTQTSTETPT
jgi:hypothetical protein